MIGKNAKILNSDAEGKKFYDNILNMIEVSNEFIGELSTMDYNGSLFWVRVAMSPIKELNNNIIGFLAVIDDITENKNLIDNLNRKNKELEDAFKLLEEIQLQLVSEDKMASIGQLSAGILHEISNPVGFVLSNLNTLKKYVFKLEDIIHKYRIFKDETKLKYAESLKTEINNIESVEQAYKIKLIEEDLNELFDDTDEGINRIRNVVNALKNFLHQNFKRDKEEYDINEGIKNTLIIARNETKYTSEVITNLSNVPKIKANGGEINQVLLNLIVNASHAIKEKIEKKDSTSENFGKITISTSYDDNFLYCSVEDNGIGIKNELINKIVEPFFTTKPVGKGTGLGLSISYDIIHNKHNGELIIESAEGEGTRVTIKLKY